MNPASSTDVRWSFQSHSISWGSLPFLTSYYVQTGALDLLSVLVAAAFAAVAVTEIRWSRASRRLRAEARSEPAGRASSPPSALRSFRDFDRALQTLSATTVTVGFGLFMLRVALPMW